MKSISGTIANTLWTQGIIQEEDIDTCRYGLDMFILSSLEIASILIIAGFVGNCVKTVLFFMSFIPLRIYAGGYHADTKLRCYLISLGAYGVFSVMLNIIPRELYSVVNVSVAILSLIIILITAPVIHANKTVNDVERKYYRKFSIWICSTETTIILLLATIFPKSPYIISLVIGQATVIVSIIAAVIKAKLVDN